ncbi:hypothetical protein Q9966_016282, partial [Columba livia]
RKKPLALIVALNDSSAAEGQLYWDDGVSIEVHEAGRYLLTSLTARQSHQGTAVAPAHPVLPTSIPGYRHVQGQWAPISVPSTATATGASGGRNIPRSSPSAALLNEAPGNPTDGFDVSEEMLLLEARWLLGVTPATVRVTEDGPRSSPTPGNTGGSSAEGNAVATPLVTALGSDASSGPSAAEPASADLAAELAIPEDELLQEALQLLGCSLGAMESSQDGPGSSPVPGDLGNSGTEGNAVAPSPLELPMAVDGQQAALNIPGTSATVGASPGSNSPPVRCDLGTSVRMALPERDLYPPQKSCAAWQQTRSVGGGLYNLGDTCYLNSILQCLTYTPPLSNYLLSRQHSQSCEKKGFCMMCTMEVHVEEVLSCSGSAVAPVAVVSELPRIGDFQFGTQEDAHEFFGCAVDAMQAACLSSSNDWDASQGGTVIDQVFGGLLRSRVTCWSCKAVSDTYEAFRDIPLDIKTATSVTRALEDFVRPEHLGGENSYKCSKCEQRVSASKRLTIHQSSNVLTVCLKRFDPFFGRKISKVVRYPEYLDLGKYTSEAAGGPLLYSLYAVLVHEGHSCQQGHYYCFVKASDGRWYKMDDESVVLCDIQTVLGQRAYLLFYVRHHDLTPGAGAERQETQSTGLAKSVPELKSPFSGGFVAPRKPEGEATEVAGSIVTSADRAQPDINGQHKVRKNSCGTEDEFGASHPRLLLCCGHHMERTMKVLKATTLVLLLGIFYFGVYHVGRLGALTPWSTADLSKALPLPDQLREVQEQLYHLRWSAKDVAERALHEGLKQAKLPGVTGRAVHEIISQALEKLEAIQVPMPDYALKSAGAAVIHSKTSPSFRTGKAKFFLYSLPVMDYMRSPELILEPENHPGNCWPFPGSQGHVFIKLSMPVIPRAITMDHVSGTAFHGESISGAPKDFAVYGFKEEHEEQGTFLGQFTFLAALNPSQTFQLKIQHPRYTILDAASLIQHSQEYPKYSIPATAS